MLDIGYSSLSFLQPLDIPRYASVNSLGSYHPLASPSRSQAVSGRRLPGCLQQSGRAVFRSSLGSTGRQSDDGQPEILNGFYHAEELLQIDGFRDVAVGVKIVTPENVLFCLRRRQDHHREFLIRDDRLALLNRGGQLAEGAACSGRSSLIFIVRPHLSIHL